MPLTVHSAGRRGGMGAAIKSLDDVAKNLNALPVELRNRYRQTVYRIVQRDIVPEARRLCPPYPDRILKSGKSRATGASRRSIRAAVNKRHGVHMAVGGARGSKRSGWYIAFEIYGVPAYGRAKNPFPFVAVRRRERFVIQEVRRETRELEIELQRALRTPGRTIRKARPPGGRVTTPGGRQKAFDAMKASAPEKKVKPLPKGYTAPSYGNYDFFKRR